MTRKLGCWVLVLVLLGSLQAQAAPLISEIFFNPPGGNDSTASLEYIELCGPADYDLNHTYLVFLENENDELNSQNPGEIENIFDLSGMSFGSNGFLVLGMRNSLYPSLSGAFDVFAPVDAANPTKAESLKTLPNGAHAYVNRDTGNGYGNGITSSIGHVGQNLDIEGSGFTAMLIKVDPAVGSAPVLNTDLDSFNNGLDVATGQAGWSILDSIGTIGEVGEPDFGRLYSTAGFGPGTATGFPGGIEPGADYVNTLAGLPEIEYVGRVGTGSDASSWMVANLTDNAASGYSISLRNYGVSGDHNTQSLPEVYVGHTRAPGNFPYGTDITVTIGAANVNFSGSHTVPEPSSLLLAASGLAVVVGVAAQRRQVTGR